MNIFLKNAVIILLLKFAVCEFVNRQSLSISRSHLSSVSLSNYGLVFFAGGLLQNNLPSDRIDIYNLTSNSHSTASLSVARYNLATTCLEKEGLAFFAGGKTISNDTNVIDIYNAITNKWVISYLSQARNTLTATTIQNYGIVIFAVGYQNNIKNDSNVIDIYNYKTNSWSIKNANFSRSNVSSTALGDIAMIGGREEGKCEVYNAKNNAWGFIYMSNLCRVNYAMASLEKNGLVFFAGGNHCFFENTIYDIIDIYNHFYNNWTIKKLSYPRTNIASTTIPLFGLVFFAGGFHENDIDGEKPYFPAGFVEVYDTKSDELDSFGMSDSYAFNTATSLTVQGIVFIAGGMDYVFNDVTLKYERKTKSKILYYVGNFGYITTINPLNYTLCPAGFLCNYYISPDSCGLGSYCPEGSYYAIRCPIGTYNDDEYGKSIGDCKKCPAGTYSDKYIYFEHECEICNTGFFCPNGSVYPKQCAENHYCPSSAEQIPCPVGYYYDGIGSISLSSCQICEKGNFCAGYGKGKEYCYEGTYAKNDGAMECETCPEGYYCTMGTAEPVICPINTFSAKGSFACTPCKQYQYTDGMGSAICLDCSGNQFEIKGWWCMSLFDKGLFVFVWIGTILSGYSIIKKLQDIYKIRKQRLIDSGTPINLYNLIFVDKVLEFVGKKIEISRVIPIKTISVYVQPNYKK